MSPQVKLLKANMAEATALGAAMGAAIGCGMHKDLQAVGEAVRNRRLGVEG
jgi:glycerol kinase